MLKIDDGTSESASNYHDERSTSDTVSKCENVPSRSYAPGTSTIVRLMIGLRSRIVRSRSVPVDPSLGKALTPSTSLIMVSSVSRACFLLVFAISCYSRETFSSSSLVRWRLIGLAHLIIDQAQPILLLPLHRILRIGLGQRKRVEGAIQGCHRSSFRRWKR